MVHYIIILLYHAEAQMFELVNIVAPEVIANWETLAFCMRYTSAEVAGFEKDAGKDSKQCCVKLFRDWVTTDHGPKPKTYQTLLSHIKEINDLTNAYEKIKKELITKLKKKKEHEKKP